MHLVKVCLPFLIGLFSANERKCFTKIIANDIFCFFGSFNYVQLIFCKASFTELLSFVKSAIQI